MQDNKAMKNKLTLILTFLIMSLNLSAQISGTWTCTGPIAFPTNISGQINGIGRCTQIKFHPTDTQIMYVTTASGGLYKSSNNGVNWTVMGTDFLPNLQCASVCVDYTNDSIIYLGTGDPNYYGTSYGVYKTTNGGITWSPSNISIGNRMALELLMDPQDHNILIAATNNGIWKTYDGGQNWTVKHVGGQFTDMKWKANVNTNTLYAVNMDEVFKSTDRGETWVKITSGTTPPGGSGGGMRIAVSEADSNIVYVAMEADEGTILKSTDAGDNFVTAYHNPSVSLTGYDSGGGGQGNYNFSLCADPTDANKVYLASHVVWKSVDGGVTWNQMTQWWAILHTDMHHILLNPYNPSQLWEANDGGVWLSTNGGSAWSTRSNGIISTEIYHAGQSNTREDLISIGTQDNGELFYSANIWKCNRGGDWGPHCGFDYSHNNSVYYFNDGDRRKLIPNQGSVSLNLPVVTDGNTCYSFTPADTNIAYVGKDTLCFTTNLLNNTPSWSIVSALGQNIKAIKATPYNKNTVYVVTSNAKLYRIENATSGSPQITILNLPSSSNISASVDVVMSDTNVVYVACNSKVYRSGNRGQTWTNITNNYPNINVINLISDYYSLDESVYIGCATGVYYRNNALTSWVNYSGGLPSIAHITDFMMFNDGTGASKLRVSYYGKGVWQCPLNKSQLPLASFMAAATEACAGESIQFTDLSANAISRQWYFQGGNPSTSTVANPLITYSTPGVYLVSLQVANSIGNNSLVLNQYITISSSHALPLTEGFENNYPQFWTKKDDGDDGVGWVLSGNAGGFGNSLNAMLFDNYNNDANGKRDEFRTPQLNFQNLDSVNLTFDLAYARYDGGYHDTLAVLISTDCGNSFTEVYNVGYTDLATAPDNTGFFIPDATQWRTETISLTPYVNSQNLMIIFQGRGHYGNCLYIDNVNLAAYTVANPAADFAAYNKFVCEGSSVQFADLSSGNPLGHAWTFAGGNPASSVDANPVVSYPTAGVYDVTLTVNNANGSDTKTSTGYITVLQPSLSSQFNVNADTLVASTQAIAYQWLFNGVIIPGSNSQSIVMGQTGAYSLLVIDSNGCSSVSLPYTFTVGINDLIVKNENIKVYPNPTNGEKNINVILDNMSKGECNMILSDIMGRIIINRSITIISNHQELNINLSGIVPGMYFLNFNALQGRTSVAIIVN